MCEQLIGGSNLGAKQKSIIDRCTASVYRTYQQNNYPVSYTHLDVYKRQYEYTKKDGTIGIDFNLKRVLDVSQTNGCLLYTSRCV